MKIAYAGFDLFYPALKALNENGCEITKIFSCKVDNVTEFNTKVTEFATKHNVDITYDKITLDDLKELKSSGTDALVCAAYYYRMPILENFKMINIHPSLLPIGRGAWPMPVAILNKHEKSGVTIHKMEESFDTGDILMQEEFELSDNENLDSFMQKANALLPDMIKKLVSNFSYYYDNATAQINGEYWDAPNENDFILNENTDFDYADLVLRAFYGFDVLYDDGQKIHRLLKKSALEGDNLDKQFKIVGGYIE